jgi:AcrR family transcriptional regulator
MVEHDTQERILREAALLFASDGIGGVSMRKVAERLGLSATAIYRHFASKEALISAVCVEGFRLFAEYLWRALGESSALLRLNRTRFEYLRFGLDYAAYYRTIFMTSADTLGWSEMPQQNLDRMRGTFQFLVDRVRECQQANCLRSGSAEGLALQIWAHGHGLVALRLAGHLGLWTELEFEQHYVASCADQLQGLVPAATGESVNVVNNGAKNHV